jgi:uncharacterized membrane protein YeaQ/YmgE (transglycosylase-associated protein family)
VGLLSVLIALVVGGLIIGALARLALPGPDPMSIPMTIVLGIAGSLLGGLVARIFVGNGGGFVVAVLGAILLLYLHRRFVQKRPLTRG